MLLLFREQTSSQSFPDLGIPKMSQKLRPLVSDAVCYSRFPHAARRQEYSTESRASVEGRSFPMMEHPTRIGNRLLAALPPAAFGLLAPYLQHIAQTRRGAGAIGRLE